MGFYRTGHDDGFAKSHLLHLNVMEDASSCGNCERAQEATNEESFQQSPPCRTVAWKWPQRGARMRILAAWSRSRKKVYERFRFVSPFGGENKPFLRVRGSRQRLTDFNGTPLIEWGLNLL